MLITHLKTYQKELAFLFVALFVFVGASFVFETVSPLVSSSEVDIIVLSLSGASESGVPIPASCPSTPHGGESCCDGSQGSSCSSGVNACGQTNSGAIQCDGSCSASVPPNPSGHGEACLSFSNGCGQTNTGTILCNGLCSATPPSNASCGGGGSLPSNFGEPCTSSSNSCGMTNTGTILSNGLCSAVPPANSLCGGASPGTAQCTDGIDNDGDGETDYPNDSGCESSSDGQEQSVSGDSAIQALPTLVFSGEASIISWSASNVTSCTVIGTNGDSWAGAGGTQTTSLIVETTAYVLSCTDLEDEPLPTESVTIQLKPEFEEF
ncbi:MAG TPA: hypothetical protein VJB70_04455 [Candidatus Paceibacterota bacterium]